MHVTGMSAPSLGSANVGPRFIGHAPCPVQHPREFLAFHSCHCWRWTTFGARAGSAVRLWRDQNIYTKCYADHPVACVYTARFYPHSAIGGLSDPQSLSRISGSCVRARAGSCDRRARRAPLSSDTPRRRTGAPTVTSPWRHSRAESGGQLTAGRQAPQSGFSSPQSVYPYVMSVIDIDAAWPTYLGPWVELLWQGWWGKKWYWLMIFVWSRWKSVF